MAARYATHLWVSMSLAPEKPLQELKVVLDRYEHEFDEPDSIRLIAHVRAHGLLTDSEWQQILIWLDDAMQMLGEGESAATTDDSDAGEDSYNSPDEEADDDESEAISIDDDPRSADWIRIVRARRRSGHMLPSWAGLWMWWIGYDREFDTWWESIGELAGVLGIQKLEADA